MTPFIFLAVWLALNILATRRLWQLRHRLRAPRMQIAMVWIAPYVGACLSLLEMKAARRQLAAEDAPQQTPAQEAAPDEIPGAGVEPFPLREHLRVVDGFALMDWAAAEEWLASITIADARNIARVNLHRAWVESLRESLGKTFWLHESDSAMILSSLEPAVAAAMGRYVATTRKRVAQTLGALAQFPVGLKSVLLVMDDDDDYYAYISLYGSDDGEQAFSGGCFIHTACPHFVVGKADLSSIEPVIAHELTHSALAHLELPLWMDEGLAVNTEHHIAGAHRGLHTPQELHRKHVAFWNDETIQQFWTGASFRRSDDGNLLSYDLARIMISQMGRNWPAFEQFAQAAERNDAGAASARVHLDFDLSGYVRLMCEREPSAAWHPRAGLLPNGQST